MIGETRGLGRRFSLAAVAATLAMLWVAGPAAGQVPTITTQATPSAFLGQPITDTATLSGGVNPTGTITFNTYGPEEQFPNCTQVVFTETVPVNGIGSYQASPYFPSNPGTYRWIATYSGDANNNSVSGACGEPSETSVVTAATPPLPPPSPLLSESLVPAFCKGERATHVGTPDGEVIQGTPGPDVIAALGGNDKVLAGEGADLVCGNRGSDRIRGQDGEDKLFGARGKDRLFGGPAADLLVGGAKGDSLFGLGGEDRLRGGSPDAPGEDAPDLCRGGAANDKLKNCER